MSYKIENVNDCTKKITFELETNNMANEIKQALVEKQKKVNIKGFRKGKAPLSMVEKLYRAEVEHDALNKFITNQYFDTIEKEDLHPIAPPVISNTNFENNDKVSYKKNTLLKEGKNGDLRVKIYEAEILNGKLNIFKLT